eukprot:1176284-Prorocentrum_minimum.AAC.3
MDTSWIPDPACDTQSLAPGIPYFPMIYQSDAGSMDQSDAGSMGISGHSVVAGRRAQGGREHIPHPDQSRRRTCRIFLTPTNHGGVSA